MSSDLTYNGGSFRQPTPDELEQLVYTVAFEMNNRRPNAGDIEGAWLLVRDLLVVVFPKGDLYRPDADVPLIVVVYAEGVDAYSYSETEKRLTRVAHGVLEY